jgi:putative transposase
MPIGLKRYCGQHHLHFITCSCYDRIPLLGSAHARNTFIEVLNDTRERYGFDLVGYVVMPEHIHLLVSEPATGTPSTVMQVLKKRVALRLRGSLRSAAPATLCPQRSNALARSLPQFWERRFYDFNVWSHKKKIEKLGYMHLNPVRRGLVNHPRDWAWSSYAFYADGGQGLALADVHVTL